MIGTTVSHYKIIGRLGQGGMGEVYLAEDTRLDRKVALKFLSPALWNEADAQQRLIREAKAASQLDHPNIVTIYGIEESEGRPFIQMAHVQGATLGEYCNAKPRTTGEILDLALQIANGLQHAHEAGVVHRDLKPGNIIVDDHGRVRILDFGIASLRGAARLTQAGSTLGTLSYTAPEIIKGQEAGPAADVYSLGVVLYQMLTSRLPFVADHDAALLFSILNDAPRPMSTQRADVAPELERIVSRCLDKLPEKRYASCAALLEDLKPARAALAPATPATASDKPSIAVLPFANMSADPENEYFSDGLSEELLNVLAKNPGLRVTGRTSAFAFKGKQEDLRDIGQKLGVATLLEGSVRKAGNRVRITTQLIKVSDGFHLWSDTYDRVLDDIFAVQDDIARSVSSALHVALLGKPATASRGSTEHYALLLQANHFTSKTTKPALEKAVALYRKVLAADPDDARAWAGLASAIANQSAFGFLETDARESTRLVREAAQRALDLDDGLPEAHETMGVCRLFFEFQWDQAGRHFRRARSLAPGAAGPLMALAYWEAFCGSLDEARRLARQSVELDPLSSLAHMARAKMEMWSLHFDEAREAFKTTLALSPGNVSVHGLAGLTYVLQGRPEEAIAEIEKEESSGYRSCALAIAFHALGRRQESNDALAELVQEGEQWGIQIAMTHAFRGELDQAFEWLERSYALRDSGIPTVKVHALFANLHADSRWSRFLDTIGLPASPGPAGAGPAQPGPA